MRYILKLAAVLIAAAYVALFFIPPILYRGLTIATDLYNSLLNTFVLASIASALSFPLAVFLGFYVSRRGAGAVLPFMMFTTAIPHTAIGLLFLPLFTVLNLVDTAPAVVLTMTAVSIPLGVGSFASGFSASLKSLDEFLSSIGVGELRNILINLRAAKTVAAVSFILMWLRSFSELGALLIIANRPVTVGVYLFELFNRGGAALAVPYSIVVALIGLCFSYLLYLISSTREG
jgi:ABC-type sulfate transport system permease component